MGRIARSWRLMKQSFGVLKQDKELLILPLLSGICFLIVTAGFVFGTGLLDAVGDSAAATTAADGTAADGTAAGDEGSVKWAIIGFLFYVVTYTIGFFFQAALVAGATQRLRGGDPTLGSALGAASKRFPSLLMWGIVAATVGMILRAIQERSGVVGKIVAGLIGGAWNLVTFFVVPVLVLEGEPVGRSIKRSWTVFKATWGETVAGQIGFGLFGFLLTLLVLGLAYVGFMASPVVGIIIGGVGIAIVMILMSAAQGVFVAALYNYATEGEIPEGFDESLASTFA